MWTQPMVNPNPSHSPKLVNCRQPNRGSRLSKADLIIYRSGLGYIFEFDWSLWPLKIRTYPFNLFVYNHYFFYGSLQSLKPSLPNPFGPLSGISLHAVVP